LEVEERTMTAFFSNVASWGTISEYLSPADHVGFFPHNNVYGLQWGRSQARARYAP